MNTKHPRSPSRKNTASDLIAAVETFVAEGGVIAGRRQKLSATPDQSGTVNLCHIMNSALKNASRSSLASSRA
ncbi:hypothetical protein [Pseudomonas avellanae]|uniref:hypothetical protein n=1 Tax=Pseudomonas avellanae TaxID=46257 RepID=UPI001673AB7E|nr:hypothetical protein [Pseudomonas avellanae]